MDSRFRKPLGIFRGIVKGFKRIQDVSWRRRGLIRSSSRVNTELLEGFRRLQKSIKGLGEGFQGVSSGIAGVLEGLKRVQVRFKGVSGILMGLRDSPMVSGELPWGSEKVLKDLRRVFISFKV